MTDTADLNLAIARLDPQSPPDRFAEAIAKLEAIAEFVKARRKELDAAIEDRVRASGPLTIGTILYRLGDETETECIDEAGALEALLEHRCGDIGGVCRDFLASKPIKHGAFRQALGEEAFKKFFKVTVKEVLKSGRPTQERKLLKLDTRFTK